MKHRKHRLWSGRAAVIVALLALLPLTSASAAGWTRLPGYQTWTLATALERGQGVSTDGTYYYFSGTYSAGAGRGLWAGN